jgi:hypothetical protein
MKRYFLTGPLTDCAALTHVDLPPTPHLSIAASLAVVRIHHTHPRSTPLATACRSPVLISIHHSSPSTFLLRAFHIRVAHERQLLQVKLAISNKDSWRCLVNLSFLRIIIKRNNNCCDSG